MVVAFASLSKALALCASLSYSTNTPNKMMKATWIASRNGIWRPCIRKCLHDIFVDSKISKNLRRNTRDVQIHEGFLGKSQDSFLYYYCVFTGSSVALHVGHLDTRLFDSPLSGRSFIANVKVQSHRNGLHRKTPTSLVSRRLTLGYDTKANCYATSHDPGKTKHKIQK